MNDANADTVLYNVRASMVAARPESEIVIRAEEPSEIEEALSGETPERVSYVQLLSLHADANRVAGWEAPVPVDLVMNDVEAEYSLLYQWSSLLAKRPVRLTVPVVPGVGNAVKVAASLGFSVKLEATQPAPPAIREMNLALQLYLHNPNVSEPIDYFHSTLLAFYNEEPATLWEIQEEHPAGFRYVTEDGKETISRRFAGVELGGDLATFPERWKADRLEEGAECCECEFLEICSGYFKWPDRDYSCDGVRGVFRTLRKAAEELKRDAAAFDAREEANDEE